MNFIEICAGISVLRTPFCGSWSAVVLVRGEQNVLIDSGADAQTVDNCIIPALYKEGLAPKDIRYLLLTHCHGDHIGGLYRLKQLTGAKIAVFSGSFDKTRDPLKYSKLIRARFPQFSPPAPNTLQGLEPDIVINDGEIFAGRLRLIHTPGHDDDTVCWYDELTQTLISGDSLQANGTELQGLGFYQDLPAYRHSLLRLKKLTARALIPGHHYLPCAQVAVGFTAVKNYIAICCDLTEQYDRFIKERYNAGETNPVALAKALIAFVGGTEPAYLFLPLYTVEQHLKDIRPKHPRKP